MSFWSTIWDAIWWFLTVFIFIAYLFALFAIITDLFRDRRLNGLFKAIWLVFLVFLPFVTALAYLIFRGRGMGERSAVQARDAQAAADDYIRSVAGSESGPTAEIARAESLLRSGAITAEEFAKLKSAALRNVG